MITNPIARRYAKALIELGAEEGAIEKFHEELAGFESILNSHPEYAAAFSSPAFTVDTKKQFLREVVEKMSLSGTVANFLFLLLEKNRLGLLSSIVTGYRGFADELSGLLRATVTSAMTLEDSQVEEIKQALEKTTGKKVLLSVASDPTLIGGVVTKIGDKIFDGSIKTQLDRIQDILQKG